MRAPLDTPTGLLRLRHLQEQTEAVGEAMDAERPRFEALRGAEAPRAVVAFQLFQTPEPLAARAVELLGPLPESARVLEPSAGLGRLYRAIRAAHPSARVQLVEVAPDCCAELYRATEGDSLATLAQRDFLATDGLGPFDAVVMNPPFQRGMDIRHTRHALAMLRPGGVLVGFCYAGAKQGPALEPMANHWEPIEPGAFRESNTNAGAVLFRIVKD